jgi:transcriptional regulator with PAS, ATPase and Fis domain
MNALHLAEKQAIEEEKYFFFRAISDYSSEGVVLVGEETRIKYMNPMAEKVFMKKKDEILGCKLKDLIPNAHLLPGQNDDTHMLTVYEEINGHKIVSNYVPLKSNNGVGAIMSFQNVTRIEELERIIRREQHKKGMIAKYRFDHILTENKNMTEIIENAKKIAKTDSTVLICGESGTGKELIAQSIHNGSKREGGPFVAVNCAALPVSLLESELFGYAEGAFTGAKKNGKAGLFELAHMGTIFLDEIGDLTLDVQSRLLRVFQEKEVIRIGDDKVIPVDIRIIAASNKNLYHLVEKGAFREDLYYRLDIVPLYLPPLRERMEDIECLCRHFLDRYSRVNHLKDISMAPGGMKILKAYSWPGNIRELEHFIERLVILSQSEIINDEIVKKMMNDKQVYRNKRRESTPLSQQDPGDDQCIEAVLKQMEYRRIKETLINVNGDKARAARMLGMSASTLWRKIKEMEQRVP